MNAWERLRDAGDAALGAAFSWAALRAAALLWLLAAAGHGRLRPFDALAMAAVPLWWSAALGLALGARAVATGGRALRSAALTPLLVAALALAAPAPDAFLDGAAFGLVGGRPGSAQVRDFSGDPRKDGYPVCRFEYNSLGFRDAEPSFAPKGARRRVLLVGDSYVWGDGVPDASGTLGSLLRAELARRAPGRWEVMSAGYPGLGLYGYSRLAGELAPRWDADAVVVGSLGRDDEDPLDPQALRDALPRGRTTRALVVGLGAVQAAHEASVARARTLWARPENAAYFGSLAGRMARDAAAARRRLLFLAYAEPHLPDGTEVLRLPEGLRYPGRATELWYAKDFHPKPALNAALARLLADRLARILP